jgi:signal transduction histidine kinase
MADLAYRHRMAGQMWRAVAIFRILTLVYAAVLIFQNHHSYAHPAAGFVALAVMTAWTVVTVTAYATPRGRNPWLISADVAVAALLVLSTRLIDTASRINAGGPTIPVSWVAASVLACAVAGGPIAGLAGAVVIAAADLAEREALPQSTFSGTVLVLIAGGVVGYFVRFGLRAEAALERAARHEAAIAERERIARGIHDSVLQVLALVSARGRELGGEAADLARLAREQESALRALVSGASVGLPVSGRLDVGSLLEPLGGSRVTVSCPAGAVLLADEPARALAAATGEALDNVRRHAGADARAWVLVEDDGAAVTVSIRDDGRGFAEGRLAEAEAAGRLGVAQSIVGRLRDVGGKACVTSSPGQGTEVELRVSRT